MIVKTILSSNRSFAFAPRSGPNAVPSRHRHGPLRGSVVVFLLLDLIAGTPAHYPLRRDGDIAPYRHYTPSSRPVARSHCATSLPRPVARTTGRSHRAHYGPAPLRGLIAMRSRCGTARCPHRAAASSPRCVAWHLAPLAAPRCRAPRSCPVAVGRDARPPPPWGLPTLPARAAAPLPVAARHCGAQLGK